MHRGNLIVAPLYRELMRAMYRFLCFRRVVIEWNHTLYFTAKQAGRKANANPLFSFSFSFPSFLLCYSVNADDVMKPNMFSSRDIAVLMPTT